MTLFLQGVYSMPGWQSVAISNQRFGLAKEELALFSHYFGYKRVACLPPKRMGTLATNAMKHFFKQTGLAPEQLAGLIHCHTHTTVSPENQAHLNTLSQSFPQMKCPLFGMSMHNCASYIAALSWQNTQLANTQSDQHHAILCLDVALTPQERVMPKTAIMGEMATVTWVSNRPSSHQLLATAQKIHGRYARGIHMTEEDKQHFEQHYVDMLWDVIAQAMQNARRECNDISLIIPHNVNQLSWHRFAKRHGIDVKRIALIELPRLGHCFNADLSLNWAKVGFDKRLKPGDCYVMATMGLGANFAAAVWQYQ